MSKKKKQSPKSPVVAHQTKNIFIAILFIILWTISLFSGNETVVWGYSIDVLTFLFWEYYKFIFSPIITILWVLFLFKEWFSVNNSRFLGIILYFISLTTIFWFFIELYGSFFNFSNILITYFWFKVSVIFMVLLLMFSLYLLFRISYKQLFKKVVSLTPNIQTIKENISFNSKEEIYEEEIEEKKSKKTQEKINTKTPEKSKQLDLNDVDVTQKITIEKKSKVITDMLSSVKDKLTKPKEETSQKIVIESKDEPRQPVNQNLPKYEKWELPKIDLLSNVWWEVTYDEKVIDAQEQEIVDKLKQFKIDVTMDWYRVWPTVIQYRLKPDDGVKLNSIVNLKADLTLALHARSIRIQAPIPWEWVVWVEIPNENRQAVWLKEVISSPKFKNPKLDIPIAIWKDVSWDIIVWDLTKMPHLLVAGQTASWKSVWMNWFIVSMLYRFSPSELKMIMVDPKMVELSVYNWIPHLLTPVITNPDKALNALKWSVAEMLRRYDLATAVWARNLKEYNARVDDDKKLPYIVIVVDELADLMMSWNKKEVEVSIARIAQMARAVWMHLIVATQRPSVDVITWLIKANIPSRIAFTVASQIDSRTVIDKAWAEDLLGMWDMLYSPTWSMEPVRVQWVFIKTEEVEAVVNQIKLTIDPDLVWNLYDDSIANGRSNTEWSIFENYSWDQDEDEELVKKAIEIVRESKKWSTSLIQRKLWLWYARAAKILDILEEMWIVWPANWSKPREVYD